MYCSREYFKTSRSELKFPTNNKNANADTTTAVSQKPPTTSDEQ